MFFGDIHPGWFNRYRPSWDVDAWALIPQLTQGGHAATFMVSDRQDRRKSRCCDSRRRRDACNRQRDFRRSLCVLRYFHGRPCGLLGATCDL